MQEFRSCDRIGTETKRRKGCLGWNVLASTWFYPNGKQIPGKQSLSDLAETVGMKNFIEEQKFNQPLVIIIHSIAFIGVGITTYNNWPLNSTASFSQKLGAFSGLIFIALIAILFLFMNNEEKVFF